MITLHKLVNDEMLNKIVESIDDDIIEAIYDENYDIDEESPFLKVHQKTDDYICENLHEFEKRIDDFEDIDNENGYYDKFECFEFTFSYHEQDFSDFSIILIEKEVYFYVDTVKLYDIIYKKHKEVNL